MKRLLALSLAIILTFSVSACGDKGGQNETSPAAENSGVDAVSSASYSMVNGEAVGRLSAVANMIQSKTGGDLFSIRTSVVYPADGGKLIEYAVQEQDENARPELISHIENPDQYDTFSIGYPKMEYGFERVLCV